MPNPLNAPPVERTSVAEISKEHKKELLAMADVAILSARQLLAHHAGHFSDWRETRYVNNYHLKNETVEEAVVAHQAEANELAIRIATLLQIKDYVEHGGYVVRLSLP